MMLCAPGEPGTDLAIARASGRSAVLNIDESVDALPRHRADHPI
jgi:hypothetical protein